VGSAQESRALEHLRQCGLTFEARNFRSRFGEIDLIMRDGEITVFVEVRRRRHRGYGGAAASIGHDKQQRIAKTALLYLKQRYSACDLPMRFDVVAIDGAHGEISWLRSAFEF
jgi:putative endonuclease